MIELLTTIGFIAAVFVSWFILDLSKRLSSITRLNQDLQKELILLKQTIIEKNLKPTIDELPSKILNSIQSSANQYKGTLGELVGYLKLRAEYDRILPLGNIVDFVCIKFPTEDDPGTVDFIDIKTGDASRLSKDQRKLKKLITNRNINFIKMTVSTKLIDTNQQDASKPE